MHLCNVCNVRPRADPVSRHVYKNIEILQANSVDLLSFVVHFSKNETCIINYARFIKQNQRKKYLYDNKLTKRDSCPSDHNTNNIQTYNIQTTHVDRQSMQENKAQ